MIMKTKSRSQKARLMGLTLIEILVGLGIISILLAVAVPSMGDLLERRRLVAATEEIVGVLNYAKAEVNLTNSLLNVRFDPDPTRTMSCVAVTTSVGMTGRCRCYYTTSMCPGSTTTVLRLFQLPFDHIKFTAAATTWAGPANVIRLTRDQMSAATEGFHVDVVSKRKAYALRVEMNAAGRVRVCSPNGDISGYATCV